MRNLDAGFEAALGQALIRPVLLVHLDWPGEAVRAHSGVGTLSWGGYDWLGVGRFGAVTMPAESPASAAKRLTLSLSSLPENMADDLAVPIRNRMAYIYFGLLDDAGALAGAPDLMIAGVMDARRFTVSPGSDGRVEYGVRIDVWNGASPRRAGSSMHSAEDQRAEFPGDTAGRHLADLPDKVIQWPES